METFNERHENTSDLERSGCEVRWGMVGCGSVTEHKSAPAYRRAVGSRLVAVASRDPDKAAHYARQHNVPLVFEQPEALIQSPEVDAVYIATPPSSHLRFALLAAKAGKPCCVEKPIAISTSEAVQMVAAFEAANLPLFVAYYRRSLPRFRHIKNRIESGAIGEVRHVHWTLMRPPTPNDQSGKSGWRTSAGEAPGGYFDDLACHGLDLFDFFLGPVTQASGTCANQQGHYDVPDAVAGTWRHACGATGTGVWNFAARAREDEVSIFGSMGRIRFSVFADEPVLLETDIGIEQVEIDNPTPIQLHHVEAIMGHLQNRCVHPSLGADAMRTSWVMDQILDRIPPSE